MADHTNRGPTGSDVNDPRILKDDRLMKGVLSRSPHSVAFPGAVNDSPVAALSLDRRFAIVLNRTALYLPGQVRDEFAQMVNPDSLKFIAAVLAGWAASHAIGIGLLADALLLIGGLLLMGHQIWAASRDFVTAINLTTSAQTQQELDQAASHLANFIAVVGVATFMALITKGVKRVLKKRGGPAPTASKLGGMTDRHYDVFKGIANEMNRIIAVRNTNPLSTRWIEKKFPAKPMEIKIKTSKKTGIVTATSGEEINAARSKGFFVIDPDGVARNGKGEVLSLGKPEWPVEPGQVIPDPKKVSAVEAHKPLVGDYDLLGVIDPSAPKRNMVLATKYGERVADQTNPDNRRVAELFHQATGERRVMHGAHDGFADVGEAGPATVFFPDGTVKSLESVENVIDFYKVIGRKSVILPRAQK
jgi:hypothetical protein